MALAILKKFSLEGLADGWTDACHVLYKAATYADVKALQELDKEKLTETQAIDNIIEFVKNHVVSGKVLNLLDDGTSELADLAKEDVIELPLETITELFSQMNGGNLDPKGQAAVAEHAPQPTDSEANTATS